MRVLDFNHDWQLGNAETTIQVIAHKQERESL